ncbi:DNA-processing protein DprA [Kaistia defluvii]|uniref:DNA-processing protein DprA n=1 Tax=Kaistia defluvii TaxID=410841 RepID=UPI00225A32D9|nr:DNA-processing protein DprA [Kaistia defluvii]MCX5517477.1 DNA-processing protein DprA [Kaistia defluvii]
MARGENGSPRDVGRPADVRLSDDERTAWLQLIRSENVGPVTFRELIRHFGSAIAALEGLPELAARSGRRVRIAGRTEAEREIDQLSRLGGQFVAIRETGYPAWLKAIDAAPPLLAVRGSLAVLEKPMIAIVGARSASVVGCRLAQRLARDLGDGGFVIASGLARGIDAAAHAAALEGGTVAVFAGGLDRLYPPENAALADRILASGGAHVSEMPLGWEPRSRDFPRRNRLVAGMASGTVIVEAAQRSGSLITARLAAEQGRAVFAVPGSPLDPRAAGTNQLIKQGAHLVTEAADVLEIVAPMLGRAFAPQAGWPVGGGDGLAERGFDGAAFLDADAALEAEAMPGEEVARAEGRSSHAASGPGMAGEGMRAAVAPDAAQHERDRDRLVEALGPAPTEIDALIRFTGLPAATVQMLLLELDLAGRIEHHAGQRVSLLS